MLWDNRPSPNIARDEARLSRLMKSRVVADFWNDYNRLPREIQELARKQYKLWLDDPNHPSARFKKVGLYWSARVTDDYRAVGIRDGDTVLWFFVGTHADYNKLLKRR
jgi:hypothetical protein